MEMMVVFTLAVLMLNLVAVSVMYVIFEVADFMTRVRLERFPRFIVYVSICALVVVMVALEYLVLMGLGGL